MHSVVSTKLSPQIETIRLMFCNRMLEILNENPDRSHLSESSKKNTLLIKKNPDKCTNIITFTKSDGLVCY